MLTVNQKARLDDKLSLAFEMLANGRPLDHVKKITTLTIAAMQRHKLAIELTRPARPGDKAFDPAKEVHQQVIIRTGLIRSLVPLTDERIKANDHINERVRKKETALPDPLSNKTAKRKDRRQFFKQRTAASHHSAG